MSKSKKWKPGEIGYIYTNELYDISFDRSVKIEVLADLESGLHPVKVKSLKSGIVYYCRHEEIHNRAAKARKKTAQDIVPEKIKEQAENLAARKMEKIMESKKPTFEDIKEKFYALAQVSKYDIAKKEIVLELAEKALFEEIKDGVVWR